MTTRDERGGALVAALGLLSVMTLLAMMSLLAGGADLAVSARQARERAVFYAAESALETALVELESGAAGIPDGAFHPPWPAPGVATRRWRDGAWDCTRRICQVPDSGDADGDPATTVVLFDRSFGHAGSPLPRGGYPLLQVLVTADDGGGRQAIVAEVAPVTCAPVPLGGWTASGPLELSGPILVEGSADLPAVASRVAPVLSGGAAMAGGAVVDPLLPLPDDVLRVLNAGATLARLEELAEPPATGLLRGIFWARGDYAGALEGDGILVVHNPWFDPVKHEASRRALEEGIREDGYDPGYSHLDPSRQPARLVLAAGGSYSGLIIADSLADATARFTLTGGLVTLTRGRMSVATSSPLRICGSLPAVSRAGRGPVRHLAGFRPVAGAPGNIDACP